MKEVMSLGIDNEKVLLTAACCACTSVVTPGPAKGKKGKLIKAYSKKIKTNKQNKTKQIKSKQKKQERGYPPSRVNFAARAPDKRVKNTAINNKAIFFITII